MSRDLKKLGLALGCAVIGALLALLLWRGKSPRVDSEHVAPSAERTMEEDSMAKHGDAIGLGTDITRELEVGGSHVYKLPLETDQFVQIVVEQQGVDVAVGLYAPDDSLILEVDSPIGREGPETVIAVAEAKGSYRLEVSHSEPYAPAGSYRITVPERRPASQEDRQRATAERIFSQAEQLRRDDTGDSLAQAIERYGETFAAWQHLSDRVREADTWYQLGLVQAALGQLDSGLDSLKKALDLYREVGNRRGEGLTLNEMGMWRRKRGERAGALEMVQEALSIFREINYRHGIGIALNNLGLLHRRLRKIEEALKFYEEALQLFQTLDDAALEAITRSNIGFLLTQQGRLEEAADHLQEAYEFWELSKNVRKQAVALGSLADVRERQGQPEKALELLKRSLELRRATGDQRSVAVATNSLGTIYLLLKDFSQAKERYEAAMTIYRDIGDRRGEGITLLNLGRLHVETGEPRKAIELHQQAAPLLKTLGDPQIEISNLYGQARALRDLEDYSAARELLESITRKVETLRSGTSRRSLRISFFATYQHYFDLLIDVLMRLGADAEAFESAERRRARALLDDIGEAALDMRRDADASLLERESFLQREINELARRFRELARQTTSDDDAMTEIQKEQRELELQLDAVRGELRKQSPLWTSVTQTEPVSLTEIQRRLFIYRNTALLAFALGDDRSFVWLVTRDDLQSAELPGRQEIEKAALEARSLLTERHSSAKVGREIHLARVSEMLLGPVAQGLRHRRLLVVAEGALLYLPFGVLPAPKASGSQKLLVHDHEIVSLPSASVLLNLRDELANRHPVENQVAVFADPVFAPPESETPQGAEQSESRLVEDGLRRAAEDFQLETFAPLPHTRLEAEAIERLASTKSKFLLRFEANKQNVLDSRLGTYKILHFATHGLLNREHPELSGLVLSLFDEAGRSLDGFLHLHEIYKLKLPVEMVVLSACRTGLGQQVRGEGLIGLTRGFMYAGAPRILVSLWNVSDEGTAELMKRFYWSLLVGRASPDVALRAAQLSMLSQEKWSHPLYWAGFILQGEWQRPGDVRKDPPPIEGHQGAHTEDEEDVHYPDPFGGRLPVWCDSLTAGWEKEICQTLQKLMES